MTTTEFHNLADVQFLFIENAIENIIEATDLDIDCERQGDILTLEFENRSKVIINKQEPLHEIWVATRLGGYHFSYENDQWLNKRGDEELLALLSEHCSIQAEAEIKF